MARIAERTERRAKSTTHLEPERLVQSKPVRPMLTMQLLHEAPQPVHAARLVFTRKRFELLPIPLPVRIDEPLAEVAFEAEDAREEVRQAKAAV